MYTNIKHCQGYKNSTYTQTIIVLHMKLYIGIPTGMTNPTSPGDIRMNEKTGDYTEHVFHLKF